MNHRQDTATPVEKRIDWVDAAKGMSILLVVVHHLVYLMEPHGLVPGPVSALNSAMASLRMPLFFLASGLFAAAALASSWRTLLHKRVAFFLYLYLLWTFLQAMTFWTMPADIPPPDAVRSWAELAWRPVLPGPAMWFLFALAVFSVVGKLVRRIPPWIQLTVSGALCAAVGAELVGFANMEWTFMARYLFFFLLGVHARTLVEAVATRASAVTVLVAGATCGATAGAAVLLDLRQVFGVAMVLNVAAVTFGVLLAAYLARFRIGLPLVVLGRNTLPVYLTNVIVVCGVVVVLRELDPPRAAGWVTPIVLAVLVVGVTLLVESGLQAVGARWLYALPRALAYRSAPAPSAAETTSPVAAVPTAPSGPSAAGPGDTGRHHVRPAGPRVLRSAPAHVRPVPRRNAFWDTDDWTASARPTTVLRPVRTR